MVHAQGSDVAPIPGTKRRTYLEENLGALSITLSDEDLAQLASIGTPSGDRYADMSPLTANGRSPRRVRAAMR